MKRSSEMVFFDIESTDLRVPFGYTLCVACLPRSSDKVKVFRIDRFDRKTLSDDKEMLRAVKSHLESAMIWVGWNSKMFDIPFLNARLIKSGLDPIEKRMHIDLMWYARRPNVALYSSRLDAIAKMFKLADQKTDLDPDTWVRARDGSTAALDYIVHHCKQDIRVLKEAFEILQPFIRNIHV